MKKIFIAGHRGMVGSALLRLLKKKNKVFTIEKKKLDLTNQEGVLNLFRKQKFDQVYIAAATSLHRDAAQHIFGPDDYGLWKSVDGGVTWQNIFGGSSESEQIFKSHINELSITSHSSENPIYFLQSSFGPNLPGPPLNYLENEILENLETILYLEFLI